MWLGNERGQWEELVIEEGSTSLVGKWLRLCTSTARGTSSTPGQRTRIPNENPTCCVAQEKILKGAGDPKQGALDRSWPIIDESHDGKFELRIRSNEEQSE